MSSTQVSSDAVTPASGTAAVPMRLEVVVVPVGDVDRARAFYEGLGWRLDGDVAGEDGIRVVQMTPTGSDASIIFGSGVTGAQPGSTDRLLLAVDDIGTASEQLRSHGADVGEPFHDAGGGLAGGLLGDPAKHASGPDPEGRSYATYASFHDPDGNTWMLQEIKERLPGRVEGTDVAQLAALLRETAEHHGAYEAIAPPHDWWDWYAAYFDARQQGAGPGDAEATADRYMADVKQVVVTRP